MHALEPRGCLVQIKFQRVVNSVTKKERKKKKQSNYDAVPSHVSQITCQHHANAAKLTPDAHVPCTWPLVCLTKALHEHVEVFKRGGEIKAERKKKMRAVISFSQLSLWLKTTSSLSGFCIVICARDATQNPVRLLFPHPAAQFYWTQIQLDLGRKRGGVEPMTLGSCEPVDAADQGRDWIELQDATHCTPLWCRGRTAPRWRWARTKSGGGLLHPDRRGVDERAGFSDLTRRRLEKTTKACGQRAENQGPAQWGMLNIPRKCCSDKSIQVCPIGGQVCPSYYI